MPTKTDRILSYLPQTFSTAPRPEVLYPLADAFGNELLLGENCLAAIMLSHWVDFADKNAAQINDLEKLAALYGLAPWRDESGENLETVEEFREHLKRYVRTFLEGTVTVQGILRVSAEALGLRIAADQPDQLDRWWTRSRDEVVTIDSLGDDAAAVLNFDRLSASGRSALPARITGTVDLSGGINLQGTNMLRLKIDGTLVEIDLTDGLAPGATLTLQQIVDIINRPPRPAIASHKDRNLILASPVTGPTSKVEVINGPNDASQRLLGVPPRSYHGTAATGVQFKGNVDLSDPVDLTEDRYLRLEIDGKHLREIDCAGPDAAHTTLNNIRDAINAAFPGMTVADDDGQHLILKSPTEGFASSISVQAPAAQNAAKKILGVSSLFVTGTDALPARAESTRDLRGTIDLTDRSNIRLRIDGGAPVTVNCAGVQPEKTQRIDIVAAINAAFNQQVAITTDRSIAVISPTAGPASRIVFDEPTADDATFDIFGIGPLVFKGSSATAARLTATPALADGGLDVRARNRLVLAVDGGTPVEIDLREAARDLAELSLLPLSRVVDHINQAFAGAQIASTDGEKIFLVSTRQGGTSKLEVSPREAIRKRRFVTRAIVIDEAALGVFGFIGKEAQGTSATGARLSGEPDLSLTADLTQRRFLRLQVDAFPAIEIDCAGGRARATTLAEIISRINSALRTIGLTADVATSDGKHLLLLSPSSGANSRLAVTPPRVALDRLFGLEPGTFRGLDATSVKFTGTVDLAAGIELAPGASIKLAIDGAPATEIALGDVTPVRRSAFEIANAINTALQAPVAKAEGRRLELHSAKKGAESSIKFETPAANDVTEAIFGIAPPREYHGAAATPAQVVGARDLSGTTDLSVFRFLSVAFDGAPQVIDCAGKATDPKAVTLAEIVESIGPNFASASADGKFLVLTSTTVGPTAQITLQEFTDGDASKALFGSSPLTDAGKEASPAVITGDKSLALPVDLSRRNALRIAVDGSRPVDIDVSGAVPAKTATDEIVDRINRVFPNLASTDADSRLQLTSPTAGPESSVSVKPLRFVEVLEYPVSAAPPVQLVVKHNDSWPVVNDGVTGSYAEVRITAPQGTAGPSLVNSGVDWLVHLFIVLERGESVRLFQDHRAGLRAEVIKLDGTSQAVEASRVQVGPIGSQSVVPFNTPWNLSGPGPSLQLNNPQAPSIVLLKGLQPADQITVDIVESDAGSLTTQAIAAGSAQTRLVGRMETYSGGFHLVNASGEPIATLLAGRDVELPSFVDQVVKVEGPLHSDAQPALLVERIARLFDVKIYGATNSAPPEAYLGVTIGVGTGDTDSLVRQIIGGSAGVQASAFVTAEELDKSTVLRLAAGKTEFRYLDCLASRFNYARFDYSRFPDGVCSERGVFDVSRFNNAPPERVRPVFATTPPFKDPPVKIDFRWDRFATGSFVVNLPADLLPRFGARFNEARFGQHQPELFENAVAEPVDDPKFVVNLISPPSGDKSNFVKATHVDVVELGWAAVRMPFRKPRFLTLGAPGRAARLYLEEDGLAGFILLEAKEPGVWGNEIAVSARQAGPAIYNVSVDYRGGRFEQARSIVLGAIKQTTQQLLQPGPAGVLQAKAAGVRAGVTRDRAEYNDSTITP